MKTEDPAPPLLLRAWEVLVSPSPALTEVADRLRARFLAGILAVIVIAGFLSGLVQLALVPGFWRTFAIMSLALGALAAACAASRTRHYRIGGAIAAVAPIGACLAVVAANPDDRVWYAFMALSVLLASVFLSLRATAAVAALGLAGILAMVPAAELDEVDAAAERSAALVRQLLTFARRQPANRAWWPRRRCCGGWRPSCGGWPARGCEWWWSATGRPARCRSTPRNWSKWC